MKELLPRNELLTVSYCSTSTSFSYDSYSSYVQYGKALVVVCLENDGGDVGQTIRDSKI